MHVAIIMDRNGEWAAGRGLLRLKGHLEGAKAIKRVVRAAVELDIDVLSLFAFSTENWQRPKEEVDFLMRLLADNIKTEWEELLAGGVKVVISGRRGRLPAFAQEAADNIVERSKENGKLVLNVALDYGGKEEIVNAARSLAIMAQNGKLEPKEIDEELFARYLYRPELPPIDLLIRSGKERRVSNFMLWQLAYAELYFANTLWPDFTKKDLENALSSFKKRKRRFGKTDEQIET